MPRYTPRNGGYRLLVDAVLTGDFDQSGALVTGLAWLAALAITTIPHHRCSMRVSRHQPGGDEQTHDEIADQVQRR